MSAIWDAHYKRLMDMMAANPVQQPATPVVAPPPTVQPGIQAMLPPGLLDQWQGGANGGQMGMPGGVDFGGKPGDVGDLSGAFGGISPGTIGGWGGGLVGGLLGGPFGALAGSVGGRALAGLLGGNETNTGAGMLGNDAKDMPGMMNAGFGDMGGGGGQDMGGANSNAGKEGDAGAMNGWQSGGYTGAGRDGVVQPSQPAGIVHEGEYVIPAHMLQGLLGNAGNKSPINHGLLGGANRQPSERQPYQSEIDYFRKNPNVAGMATEDEAVIINPFKNMNQEEHASVVMNEMARVMMRNGAVNRPSFQLTDAQKRNFQGYGTEQDIRETIAARLLSGDPSAGAAQPDQLEFVNMLRKFMPAGNRPKQ